MRRVLSIACEGAAIAATLDAAPGATGLLIVSGGTEIRCGAHGGMARLAREVAAAGFPVVRFDRRGVGDSGGDDPGFMGSGPDIAAAAAALRAAGAGRILGFGLCDGATALALHHRAAGIDALALANPWIVEPAGNLPPPAAIRRRYLARLASRAGWRKLLTLSFDARKLLRGLRAASASDDGGLAARVAAGVADTPTGVLLAQGDATATAFEAAWSRPTPITRVADPSHSFAGGAGAEALLAFCLAALRDLGK